MVFLGFLHQKPIFVDSFIKMDAVSRFGIQKLVISGWAGLGWAGWPGLAGLGWLGWAGWAGWARAVALVLLVRALSLSLS